MEHTENQTSNRYVDHTHVLHMLNILKTSSRVNAITLARDDQSSTDRLDRDLAIKWFQDMERVIDENITRVSTSAETCMQLKQRCGW